MKITIDTSTDSHEHIKRAIRMLQSIVGEEAMPDSPEPAPGAPAPMDIFGGSSGGDIFSNAPTEPNAPENAPAENSAPFMGIFDAPSPPSQIQIISDEQPANSPVEASVLKSDDEPLADEELFADLFTKEELERMGGKAEEKTKERPYSRVYF